ncbi:MAG TPA: maltotransferase domain-containing protein, partial [Acidimicrobiia bacterium]|nr:maltotransferase domain-containing protein [Acidimicrobiia bacterium]
MTEGFATTKRVVIEDVTPRVDEGRFPAKRIVGDVVTVEADVFADGHDRVAAMVRYKRRGDKTWRKVPMEPIVNDRFEASFTVDEIGRYAFTVEGWVDHYATWREGLLKKQEAGVVTSADLDIGAGLFEAGASRASGKSAELLSKTATLLRSPKLDIADRVEAATSAVAATTMRAAPDRTNATIHDTTYEIEVDRERARFSAWYELFPRSWGESGGHGTFLDVAD